MQRIFGVLCFWPPMHIVFVFHSRRGVSFVSSWVCEVTFHLPLLFHDKVARFTDGVVSLFVIVVPFFFFCLSRFHGGDGDGGGGGGGGYVAALVGWAGRNPGARPVPPAGAGPRSGVFGHAGGQAAAEPAEHD